MIKIENITKKYDEKIVLNNINCTLPDTGLIIIRGSNGSGKTTLLNLIGSLIKPDSGHIYIDDVDITTLNEKQLATYREENVNFIFQECNLFEQMTVEDNIRITGTTDQFDEAIALLQLEHLLTKRAKELSGGEQARVAIARALMKNSRIILVDEPTAAIDGDSRQKIFKLLELLSENHLVIAVTHDEALIEGYGNVLLTMEDGQIIENAVHHEPKNSNYPKPYKMSFDSFKFCLKNQFVNNNRTIRTTVTIGFSILLIVVAAMIGTLDFDKMHYDTLIAENSDIFGFRSYIKDGEYTLGGGEFTDEDLNTILSKLDHPENLIVSKSYQLRDGIPLSFYSTARSGNPSDLNLYHDVSTALNFKDASLLKDVDLGHLPTKSNEIVISSFLAESIVELGVYTDGMTYKPSSVEQLLNDHQEISIDVFTNNCKVVVVGIVHVDLSKYEPLKNHSYTEYTDYEVDLLKKQYDILYYASDVYVASDFVQDMPKYFRDASFYVDYTDSTNSLNVSVFEQEIVLDTSETIDKLNANEIIISQDFLYELNLSKEEYMGLVVSIDMRDENTNAIETIENLTVVGLSKDNRTYLSPELLPNRSSEATEVTSHVMIRETDSEAIANMLKEFPIYKGIYRLTSPYSEIYLKLDLSIKIISFIFKIIALIFAIIGIAFLINYIKRSVSLHKREIVTLKCFGLKDAKIMQIFATEATIISVISYILAVLFFVAIRLFVNAMTSNIMHFEINVLPFDALIILWIFVIIVFASHVISYIALTKISKMQPNSILHDDAI